MKSGHSRHGVSKSRWLFWGKKGSNQRARMYFENAEALEPTFRDRVLPAGTEFIAVGWGQDEADKSVFLEVKVAGVPVQAKLYYLDSWVGKVREKRLGEFERWVRLDLCQIVESPDEKLVDVPGPSASSSLPPRPVRAPVVQPMAPTSPPRLRVLAVSVEPVRVVPGGEISLVVTYSVDGVAPGATLAVTERRTIVRDGGTLTSVEQVVHRPAGVHQSRQPIRIPATLAAGIYELRAAVRAAGIAGEGSAVFEVTNDAR